MRCYAFGVTIGLLTQQYLTMMRQALCHFVTQEIKPNVIRLFGGYGYMCEDLVERLYGDNRMLSIGGMQGMMKEIISKRLLNCLRAS